MKRLERLGIVVEDWSYDRLNARLVVVIIRNALVFEVRVSFDQLFKLVEGEKYRGGMIFSGKGEYVDDDDKEFSSVIEYLDYGPDGGKELVVDAVEELCRRIGDNKKTNI